MTNILGEEFNKSINSLYDSFKKTRKAARLSQREIAAARMDSIKIDQELKGINKIISDFFEAIIELDKSNKNYSIGHLLSLVAINNGRLKGAFEKCKKPILSF